MKINEIDQILHGYQALVLDPQSRQELLTKIKPLFPDVIAHHITLKYPATNQDPLVKQPTVIKVIGIATDKKSVQAAIVDIDGKAQRPDGKTYHITISIDKDLGAKPAHSNQVIEKYGWQKLTDDINIQANMQFIAFEREKHGK